MSRIFAFSLLTTIITLTGCDVTAPKLGSNSAKTTATGSAGGATAQNVNSQLSRCDRPAGTLALVEDTTLNWYHTYLSEYRLGSTIPVLRLLVQQSNCFIIVERGRAAANMQQERALQQSGELRNNSNFGKGQIVAADYSLTPEVLTSARGTSGGGANLGRISRGLGILSDLAGGIRTNEAAVMLTLIDNRSGVQIAAAEGSSSNTDFSLSAALFGSSAGGGASGYTKTPQGKVIIAAFTDSYNNIVNAVQNYSPQTMGDRGLGTGGRLAIDGSPQPPGSPAVAASAATNSRATLSVRDAQAKLNQLGYNVGTPDGSSGSRTVTQLRSFQRARNLPITGQFDQATLNELAK